MAPVMSAPETMTVVVEIAPTTPAIFAWIAKGIAHACPAATAPTISARLNTVVSGFFPPPPPPPCGSATNAHTSPSRIRAEAHSARSTAAPLWMHTVGRSNSAMPRASSQPRMVVGAVTGCSLRPATRSNAFGHSTTVASIYSHSPANR